MNITIPEYAYYSENEKININELLSELKALDQSPFPQYIDDKFKELADFKRKNFPKYLDATSSR